MKLKLAVIGGNLRCFILEGAYFGLPITLAAIVVIALSVRFYLAVPSSSWTPFDLAARMWLHRLMTLRDIGTWFSDLWRLIGDGFHIVKTQSFWDWPLWISIPVAIGVPVLVFWFVAALKKEARSGENDSLGWTIAYGVATVLCALVTFDIWVSTTVFEKGDADSSWLRVTYPIMTAFFGMGFLVSVVKRFR